MAISFYLRNIYHDNFTMFYGGFLICKMDSYTIGMLRNRKKRSLITELPVQNASHGVEP